MIYIVPVVREPPQLVNESSTFNDPCSNIETKLYPQTSPTGMHFANLLTQGC